MKTTRDKESYGGGQMGALSHRGALRCSQNMLELQEK